MRTRRKRKSLYDLNTLRGRAGAYLELYFWDHGILRIFWTNLHEIAPGVWRSNHPSPFRVRRLARKGFRSVLTLRRNHNTGAYLLEAEACRKTGLVLHNGWLPGGKLLPRKDLLELVNSFRTIERPLLIHCKSGIDRTGLASFLYLLAETDTPPEIARRQLSFDYLHLKHGRHGILDVMADSYLEAFRKTGIGLRDWIATEYDPEVLGSA